MSFQKYFFFTKKSSCFFFKITQFKGYNDRLRVNLHHSAWCARDFNNNRHLIFVGKNSYDIIKIPLSKIGNFHFTNQCQRNFIIKMSEIRPYAEEAGYKVGDIIDFQTIHIDAGGQIYVCNKRQGKWNTIFTLY